MVPEIDQETFASHLDAGDVVVVDVREAHEFGSAHVPGAWNLPLSALAERLGELPRGRRVHVICQSGKRSARATALMRAVGVDATNVGGGTGAWIAAGRPTRAVSA